MFGAQSILSALGYCRNMAVQTSPQNKHYGQFDLFCVMNSYPSVFCCFCHEYVNRRNSDVIFNRTRLIFLSFSTATEGINRS